VILNGPWFVLTEVWLYVMSSVLLTGDPGHALRKVIFWRDAVNRS
jgi:hypothetical protein